LDYNLTFAFVLGVLAAVIILALLVAAVAQECFIIHTEAIILDLSNTIKYLETK